MFRFQCWLVGCSAALCVLATGCEDQDAQAEHPNFVIIYMDDLGYGDLRAYNSSSKIDTPHIDQFASNATVFTDAHSSSAVCTPSRYSLLTGRYSWRSWLKAGVTNGYSPSVIRNGETTIPMILKEAGYQTAAIGKWHLGFGSAEPSLAKFATGFTDEPVSFDEAPDI